MAVRKAQEYQQMRERYAQGAGVSDGDPALSSIARAVAYLALHAAELTDSDLVTKATFLERQLGLSRADAAAVLNSSVASIRMAFSAAKKKTKGARRG